MNTRMNRSRMNIGVYCLQPYARSEQHIKDLRDCGVDFVVGVNYDKPMLDLFAKYNVGAVVNGVLPGWWGGNGENAGKMEQTNPIEKYHDAAKNFVDHPAIWSVDTGDEPSALDFPYYAKVFDLVNTEFPKQFPYLNLYPNYASVVQNNAQQTVNQLGTATYAEHIEQYCKYLPADYICYDFYVYSGRNVAKAYDNLRIVADAAQRTGRSMWIVLQVNSSRPEEWMSENRLRFQAYSAMAFGAETILWACYTAGWWKNQVLDDKGEKTEQYDKLKKINKEIATISERYMTYRRCATHFVGFGKDSGQLLDTMPSVDSLDTGYFMNLHADGGQKLVVGDMVSRTDNSARAMFVCAADDFMDANQASYNVVFRCDARNVSAYGANGVVPVVYDPATGEYSIAIKSCEGILIEAK